MSRALLVARAQPTWNDAAAAAAAGQRISAAEILAAEGVAAASAVAAVAVVFAVAVAVSVSSFVAAEVLAWNARGI